MLPTQRSPSSGEFPCPSCNLTFSRRYNLQTHFTAHHLKLKPYVCVCGRGFSRRYDLGRHRAVRGCARASPDPSGLDDVRSATSDDSRHTPSSSDLPTPTLASASIAIATSSSSSITATASSRRTAGLKRRALSLGGHSPSPDVLTNVSHRDNHLLLPHASANATTTQPHAAYAAESHHSPHLHPMYHHLHHQQQHHYNTQHNQFQPQKQHRQQNGISRQSAIRHHHHHQHQQQSHNIASGRSRSSSDVVMRRASSPTHNNNNGPPTLARSASTTSSRNGFHNNNTLRATSPNTTNGNHDDDEDDGYIGYDDDDLVDDDDNNEDDDDDNVNLNDDQLQMNTILQHPNDRYLPHDYSINNNNDDVDVDGNDQTDDENATLQTTTTTTTTTRGLGNKPPRIDTSSIIPSSTSTDAALATLSPSSALVSSTGAPSLPSSTVATASATADVVAAAAASVVDSGNTDHQHTGMLTDDMASGAIDILGVDSPLVSTNTSTVTEVAVIDVSTTNNVDNATVMDSSSSSRNQTSSESTTAVTSATSATSITTPATAVATSTTTTTDMPNRSGNASATTSKRVRRASLASQRRIRKDSSSNGTSNGKNGTIGRNGKPITIDGQQESSSRVIMGRPRGLSAPRRIHVDGLVTDGSMSAPIGNGDDQYAVHGHYDPDGYYHPSDGRRHHRDMRAPYPIPMRFDADGNPMYDWYDEDPYGRYHPHNQHGRPHSASSRGSMYSDEPTYYYYDNYRNQYGPYSYSQTGSFMNTSIHPPPEYEYAGSASYLPRHPNARSTAENDKYGRQRMPYSDKPYVSYEAPAGYKGYLRYASSPIDATYDHKNLPLYHVSTSDLPTNIDYEAKSGTSNVGNKHQSHSQPKPELGDIMLDTTAGHVAPAAEATSPMKNPTTTKNTTISGINVDDESSATSTTSSSSQNLSSYPNSQNQNVQSKNQQQQQPSVPRVATTSMVGASTSNNVAHYTFDPIHGDSQSLDTAEVAVLTRFFMKVEENNRSREACLSGYGYNVGSTNGVLRSTSSSSSISSNNGNTLDVTNVDAASLGDQPRRASSSSSCEESQVADTFSVTSSSCASSMPGSQGRRKRSSFVISNELEREEIRRKLSEMSAHQFAAAAAAAAASFASPLKRSRRCTIGNTPSGICTKIA